jgi:hypothetical protein
MNKLCNYWITNAWVKITKSLFLSSCHTPAIFLPWENENDNDSVNSLLEGNHYFVEGKKDCSFSEGQDINQSHTKTFIITPAPLLMGRITT